MVNFFPSFIRRSKQTRSAIEMSQTDVKWGDLHDLPFELILSYLSLEDLIKSRAVSRRWYDVINSFRPKSLCFSTHPIRFIQGKNRWIIGEFAQNFINSTKFGPFFQTFGQSILSKLKKLRLCKLDLGAEDTPAFFVQILNSFGQLEELDLYDIDRSSELDENFQVHLYLPMLKSIQLVELPAITKLTLNAPRLQNVKHFGHTKVELVHGESVEKLIIYLLDKMEVSKMKNLKLLYCGTHSFINSTLLSTLEQLNEIHLDYDVFVLTLFEQKAHYRRSNLKIFCCGCLLNGPSDPATLFLDYSNKGYLAYLIANPSKVAKEIPLFHRLPYSAIEAVAPGLEIDLLKRFTNFDQIDVDEPVQDVDRFLELLKNLNNIVGLDFGCCYQPPELFDQLPDHFAIQSLNMVNAPVDLAFLFKLKSLINLQLLFPINIDLVSRALEELPFLSFFEFKYLNNEFVIRIDHSKQFTVSFDGEEKTTVSDINAVVQWIREKATEDEESEDEEW